MCLTFVFSAGSGTIVDDGYNDFVEEDYGPQLDYKSTYGKTQYHIIYLQYTVLLYYWHIFCNYHVVVWYPSIQNFSLYILCNVFI